MEQPRLQLLGHLLGNTSSSSCTSNLGDFLLCGLEMAIRLLGVIDGRYKVFPVVASCQQTTVGSEESQGSFMLHHQHAKHLTAIGILQNLPMTADIRLHLLGSLLAQRMGLVAEGVGEPLGPGTIGR